MSWKPEVIADGSGQWTGNAMVFATREESDLYVRDLSMRWLAVRDTRSREVTDPVTAELTHDPESDRWTLRHLPDPTPPARSWDADAQKRFRAFKGQLTRAQRSGNPFAVLRACNAFFSYYEDPANPPFPDQWHRWNIAREDARAEIERGPRR